MTRWLEDWYVEVLNGQITIYMYIYIIYIRLYTYIYLYDVYIYIIYISQIEIGTFGSSIQSSPQKDGNIMKSQFQLKIMINYT